MESRQSLYLIFLLLVALVFGPVMVLTQERGEPPLKPLPTTERLMDAPNSVSGSRSPLPDARIPIRGPFPR